MNISNFFKRAFFVLFLGVVLALIPYGDVEAKKNYDFEVSMETGFFNTLLSSYGAPVKISIKNNNGSDFEGQLQLIVPGPGNDNVLYEEDLVLGVGETKEVPFVVGVQVQSQYFNVRVTDKKGKVLWSELQPITISKERNQIIVGVLSDDFSALSYMDRQHFLSNDEMETKLFELTLDTLPTDSNALDMIDVIVISDFSTDLITDEQINALSLWVEKGGLLIIGTGSTANKTLSGLNGELFNINIKGKQDVYTTLGVNETDYSYLDDIIAVDSYSYSSWGTYDDYEYWLRDDSQLYYYFGFDDYDYENGYFDNDGDGIRESGLYKYCYTYNEDGYIVDAYGNVIDPEYNYLYDGSGFYEDPVSGEFVYKYYDERYGVPGDDYYYNEWKEDVLEQPDLVDGYCMREYCNLYGFNPRWFIYEFLGIKDPDELEEKFDELFGRDYEEFCDHQLYLFYMYEQYYEDHRPDLSIPEGALFTLYEYEQLEVQQLEVNNMETITEITGDVEDGTDYTLGIVYDDGFGKIAVMGIDFTKNPMPKLPFAGEFFRNLIEKLAGEQIAMEASNYGGGGYYTYANGIYSSYSMREAAEYFFKGISIPPQPPIIVYVVVIGVYLIGAMVIYLVLHKKNKTFALWKIYPIAAVGFSMLVFCVGFSTRLLRLNINISSLLFTGDNVTHEEDYVSAVIPKSKDYTVTFSNDVILDKSFNGGTLGSSYFSEYSADYDNYVVKYHDNYDNVEGVITNKVALQNEMFKTEAAYLTQGGLEISYQGYHKPEYTFIKNNYSTDLKDVLVLMEDSTSVQAYYFDKIKAGEEVNVASGYTNPNNYIGWYYDESISEFFNSNKIGSVINGMLFGSLSKSYRKYVCESNTVRYLSSYYQENGPDDDYLWVVGFPESSVGKKVTENKFAKVNRSEAITMIIENDKMIAK